MKGLGTDEADMIRTLAFTTNTHIQKVRHAFDLKYSAKGDLITWIKGYFFLILIFSICM